MSQSKAAVEAVSPSGFVRVEHVRAHGAVRLIVGGATPRVTILELPVGDFLGRLGLMNWPAAEPVAYLIFAGNEGRTIGGAGDYVASFPTEDVAREAFRGVCQAHSPDWAQLVRVDRGGRLTVICWRGGTGGQRSSADLSRPEAPPEPEGPATVVLLPQRGRGGGWAGRTADGTESPVQPLS